MSVPIYFHMEKDKQAFLEGCAEFWEACTQSRNGLNLGDLDHVARAISATRHQQPGNPKTINYVDSGEERRGIIKQVGDHVTRQFVSQRLSRKQFEVLRSNLHWAILQVAPMEHLRGLKSEMDASDIPSFFHDVEAISTQWTVMFKMFFPKGKPSKDEKQGGTPGVQKRAGKPLRKECLERDGDRCVITKASHPTVAHIYPFNNINQPNRETLRLALARLYGAEKAQAILDRLLGKKDDNNSMGIIDSLQNVISLSPNLHEAWDRAEFALEPSNHRYDLTKEQYAMDITVHWLRHADGVPTMMADFSMDAKDKIQLQFPNILFTRTEIQAIDMVENLPILSGTVITIYATSTEDLPDYDIMQLQYDILRLATLCGGAESIDDDDDDDDDEEEDAGMEVEMMEEAD